MTQDRDDRLRKFGRLTRDARTAHSGYRSVSRGRRLVLWAAGALVAVLAVVGITSADGDDEDEDGFVTGPVPVQVEEDDDDGDDD